MANVVDLTTITYVKRAVDLGGSGKDDLIPDLITAASRAINRRYERELTPQTAAATRRFRTRVRDDGRAHFLDLAPYDLRGNPTTVTLNPQSASSTVLTLDEDFTLLPTGGHPTTGTYLILELARDLNLRSSYSDRFGAALLDVSGAWGAWATADVVDDVQRACAVTVASWLDRAFEEYAGGEDEPRQSAPSRSRSWAIPDAAHALLLGAGIPRMTV